jgi:colanic acid/amylovoran biosynthesis glycosyltransferase
MSLKLVEAGPPLKVGYVIKRFPRLSETFILNELLELRRQGVEVEIFSLLKPREEIRHELLASLDANITYLSGSKVMRAWTVSAGRASSTTGTVPLTVLLGEQVPPMPELLPGKEPEEAAHLCFQATNLALLAAAQGIAHLHAHFASNAATVALIASRLCGVPYSFTAHARDIYHTYVDEATDAALRRRKIAEASFVVTVSDYNRRHLVELAGEATAPKIRRLYNGIDQSRFFFQRQTDASPSEPPLFLAVGRLIGKKGFAHLVEACRILRDRGVASRCVIIGEGPDRDALLAQVRVAGLEGQVELAGAQPQEAVIAAMRWASAMVLPCMVSASGDRDGLPTVLLEALAFGLPAISTTVAGIPEIIEHERSGLLVPPEDPARLAKAMMRLLADPGLRQRLRREGRAKAEKNFDLTSNVALLRDYFARSANCEALAAEEVDGESRLRRRG